MSTWFTVGSPLVHHWISGCNIRDTWISFGSLRGASGEHPWFMYPKKILENTPSYGCRVPDNVDVHQRSMHPEADHFEPNYPAERSNIDYVNPGHGHIEPGVGLGEPRSVTNASEAIRFEC